MGEKDGMNLGSWKSSFWEQKKSVSTIVVGCVLLMILVVTLLPRQYESTTLVQTRSSSKIDISGAAAAMAALGVGSSSVSSPTMNYIELMKSRTVLAPIIDSLDWGGESKKPEVKQFVKNNLDIRNTKGTNLIEVTAKGRTPEEAQQISQSVVDNFLAMQTDKNQQTQSLLVKFLNDRIETAKKESDDAAQKLALFSRENKIYSPDEQAKLALEQLNAYDKVISDMQVQQKSAQAQYDVATSKLGNQKAGAKDYSINDNVTVQGIRSQIVAKEVELVGLRQKYTDNHPEVIAAQRQLKELRNSLSNEVSAVVDSNAASLNTAQMELVKSQAIAQAQMAASSASETAVKAKRDEKERAMGTFPDAVMQYMQLERDSKIKQQIYTNLVKECEQNKIQEAMDSMDIQVIDPANLPDKDKPVFPKWKIMIPFSILIGFALSAIYVRRTYYKRYRGV